MGITNIPDSRYVDFLRDVAEGKVRGVNIISDFGYNDSFGTTRESLNPIGGLNYWLDNAQQLKISSDSSNDTLSGTGAQKVYLSGLDANYDFINETLDMNGTTTVTTSQLFLRVNEFEVVQAGSIETNDGQINLEDNTQTNILKAIMPGEGQARTAVWTVPRNRTTYLVAWHGSELSNKGTRLELWARPINSGVWRVERLSYLRGTQFERTFSVPLPLPGKTDIELRVLGIQTDTQATGGFAGY